MVRDSDINRLSQALQQRMANEGRIIEGGWQVLHAMIPADASPLQVSEMKKSFWLGAQHLFASIMSTLDPDSEPTEADLHRFGLIAAELEAFTRDLKAGKI